jgi:hypothetical protein
MKWHWPGMVAAVVEASERYDSVAKKWKTTVWSV